MPATTTKSETTHASSIRSMTGQGRAQCSSELWTFTVELRSVNHRGVKCSIRTSDAIANLTPKIESALRTQIHRGSINVNVAWKLASGATKMRVCEDTVAEYYRQLRQAQQSCGAPDPIDWTGLLQLPGTLVPQNTDDIDQTVLWSSVSSTLQKAIDDLNQMRSAEGREMLLSLRDDLNVIDDNLAEIQSLAPDAADKYQRRLRSKVEQTLAENDLAVDSIDLLREIQIYADRVDISEEITRLQSHLKLFGEVLSGPTNEAPGGEAPDGSAESADVSKSDPAGRKLDFIIQEMFRETNTIGSKASHATVAKHVVEIKCGLERMRELVQNLE
ncbi:MAG: DUF1732 domain-containing protein [Planctomycetota bacterium]